MAAAVPFEHAAEDLDIARVVRRAILLGAIQAACVLVVSFINKLLTGVVDSALTGVVAAIGIIATAFLPGWWTRARSIDGIATAAGIGLGATAAFLLLDVSILQPLHAYTNRWAQIGGGSNWWYHPVWWMLGTYTSWMGAWILANQTNKRGRPSIAAGVILVAVIAVILGVVAASMHFPGAQWAVPAFLVACIPALALGVLISSRGARTR